MQKIAVFDLDNTLVNGSSLYYLIQDLFRAKYIGFADVVKFTKWQFEFRTKRTEPAEAATTVTQMALQIVAGRSIKEVDELLAPVAMRIVDHHLISATLTELRALKLANYEIWIASASPIEIVRPIGRLLGADEVIATESQTANGFFTGELAGLNCHGYEKYRRVNEKLEAKNYDWKQVLAFSDSTNDLPMLAAAAQAVVVNPNRQFEMMARKNQWRIIKPNPKIEMSPDVLPNCELQPSVRLSVRPGADFRI